MMVSNRALPEGFEPSKDGSHAIFTQLIEISLNDDRSYKLIRLPNEMEVLLVHDPNTDKSAAALDVHVGHLTDPVRDFSHPPLHFFLWSDCLAPPPSQIGCEQRRRAGKESFESNCRFPPKSTQRKFHWCSQHPDIHPHY